MLVRFYPDPAGTGMETFGQTDTRRFAQTPPPSHPGSAPHRCPRPSPGAPHPAPRGGPRGRSGRSGDLRSQRAQAQVRGAGEVSTNSGFREPPRLPPPPDAHLAPRTESGGRAAPLATTGDLKRKDDLCPRPSPGPTTAWRGGRGGAARWTNQLSGNERPPIGGAARAGKGGGPKGSRAHAQSGAGPPCAAERRRWWWWTRVGPPRPRVAAAAVSRPRHVPHPVRVRQVCPAAERWGLGGCGRGGGGQAQGARPTAWLLAVSCVGRPPPRRPGSRVGGPAWGSARPAAPGQTAGPRGRPRPPAESRPGPHGRRKRDAPLGAAGRG